MTRTTLHIPVACLLALVVTGCATIERAAMRRVSGMFTGGGASNVFVQDDDPELVRAALPFALKTYETLLAADPANRDLYLAAAAGFVQYANAFVEAEADRLEDEDYAASQRLRRRAVNLYRRGRDYGLAGLECSRPGIGDRLREAPVEAAAQLRKPDVPLVYWTAAGWAGAIAAAPGDMAMVAELPVVETMMRRALALDPDFDHGALHEFFLLYEGSRSEALGGSPERARAHFDRALELTGGRKASTFVAMASTVAVSTQDYELFRALLEKAMAVDVDAVPDWRLANILAQDTAAWLLSRSAELFIDYESEEN